MPARKRCYRTSGCYQPAAAYPAHTPGAVLHNDSSATFACVWLSFGWWKPWAMHVSGPLPIPEGEPNCAYHFAICQHIIHLLVFAR